LIFYHYIIYNRWNGGSKEQKDCESESCCWKRKSKSFQRERTNQQTAIVSFQKKKGWKNPNVQLRGQSRYWPHLKQILQMENYSRLPPSVPTYTNIEAPPSLLPAKKYCDITGFVAPYRDPKNGLRYCSVEGFQYIHSHLSREDVDKYLTLRNAQPKLK